MAEEAVKTEEEIAAEEQAATEKAAEEQAAKEAEEAAAKEKSDLEKHEEELLQQEETERKEREEAEDTDVEDLDWDKLKADHPEIAKLGYKDMADLVKRHFGSLEQFQKDRKIVATFEKMGFDTQLKREELYKKIEAGDVKAPEKTPGEEDTKPKTFAEMRSKALSEHVAKSPMYHTTDDEGERVPLGEEAQKATASHLSEILEAAIPSQLVEGLVAGVGRIQQLEEDYLWDKYVASQGEDAPSDEVREAIQKHVEEYPHVYADIIGKARENKQNWWGACHRYHIRNTKADEIDEAKNKRSQEEREKEAAKKKAAKIETVKKTMPSGTSKSWKDMTLPEKEAELKRQENEGT